MNNSQNKTDTRKTERVLLYIIIASLIFAAAMLISSFVFAAAMLISSLVFAAVVNSLNLLLIIIWFIPFFYFIKVKKQTHA